MRFECLKLLLGQFGLVSLIYRFWCASLGFNVAGSGEVQDVNSCALGGGEID